jgi:hypothetical protein
MKFRGNGCGPSGLLGKLIPEKLLGVSVRDVCNLHDERYEEGGDSIKRKIADQEFLNNMIEKIDSKPSNLLINKVRKLGAYLYYFSVRIFGKLFYKSS